MYATQTLNSIPNISLSNLIFISLTVGGKPVSDHVNVNKRLSDSHTVWIHSGNTQFYHKVQLPVYL